MCDILPSSRAKDAMSQWLQGRQTCGTNFPRYKDPGATHLEAASVHGQTKELLVDLRRTKESATPVYIQEVGVDIVEDYKYLGVDIGDKLDWRKNTDALYRKLLQHAQDFP